jgi:hypothetical protein
MRDHVASRRGSAARALFAVCVLAAWTSAALGGAFGVDLASAHGGHGRADGSRRGVVPAAAGIVQSAPSGDSFTIEARSGATETIDVTSATTYIERGVSSPSHINVAAGDLVAVFGTTFGSTVTASQIVIEVPRAPRSTSGPVAAGIVHGTPGADSFTIETRGGASETIDVTSPSTTYYERGVASPSLANVANGDFVVAFGTVSGSTVTATKIVIGGAPRHHGFAVAGTVQSTPSADSFMIKTPSGPPIRLTSPPRRAISSAVF